MFEGKTHVLLPVDKAEDSKFTGAAPLSTVPSCSSGCSIFARKNNDGYKASKCEKTDCPATGRRRRRSNDQENQLVRETKRYRVSQKK